DDAPLPPQLVAVEMLVVELEAVRAEERPRLKRQRAEIHRAAAHPVQALEHRGDLRRRHVVAALGHLLIGALALADEVAPALHTADEADAVEIGAVLGPVLDLAHVVEQDRAAALVPRPRRDHAYPAVADADPVHAHQSVIAQTIFAAERRTGSEREYRGRQRNSEQWFHRDRLFRPTICRTQAASGASGFMVR